MPRKDTWEVRRANCDLDAICSILIGTNTLVNCDGWIDEKVALHCEVYWLTWFSGFWFTLLSFGVLWSLLGSKLLLCHWLDVNRPRLWVWKLLHHSAADIDLLSISFWPFLSSQLFPFLLFTLCLRMKCFHAGLKSSPTVVVAALWIGVLVRSTLAITGLLAPFFKSSQVRSELGPDD